MSPRTRSFYLDAGEQVYAQFDDRPPREGYSPGAPAVGVLLCPLFGNADLCAYRARYDWAKALAAAGHSTLRIDLPGGGDSAGGPHDPHRPRAWRDALAAAASWLRDEGGCVRVAAIGIALGGLLAYEAACAGAAIDDLVLWSVPARGRMLVRQLRALSQMEASRETVGRDAVAGAGEDSRPDGDAALPQGALETAGFVLSAETVAALQALDLTRLELPRARDRRVLLLDRDGLPVDARLQAALERSGAQVLLAPGPGYGAMVAPPQQSKSPHEAFATVNAWLASAPSQATVAAPAPVRASEELQLTVAGRSVRETPLAIACGEQQLAGVLAEPEHPLPLCAVLLNAGALRRIGPNRMWVEAARRWAARGVITLRIDLAGIGDSDGDASTLEQDEGFYIPRYVAQTEEVLSALRERGLPQRFVLAGLCSGAYWAFQVALQDESVRGAFMVNPRALFWDWSVGGVRDARNVRKALRLATWRKLASGQITHARVRTIAEGVRVALASLPERLRARRRSRAQGEDELGAALRRIAASGAELLAVFTDREPVYEELLRDGDLPRMTALPNVRVESIPGPLTSHTLEPLPLQREVHRMLDAAMDRVIAAAGAPLSAPDAAVRSSDDERWAATGR